MRNADIPLFSPTIRDLDWLCQLLCRTNTQILLVWLDMLHDCDESDTLEELRMETLVVVPKGSVEDNMCCRVECCRSEELYRLTTRCCPSSCMIALSVSASASNDWWRSSG